jgi:hypothetical protein
MLSRLKQYALIGAAIYAFYFLLSHHFIFTSLTDFELLNKQKLTLKYTFFSLKQVSPEAVMRIPELRDVGIGDVMVAKGIVNQVQLDLIMRKVDSQ